MRSGFHWWCWLYLHFLQSHLRNHLHCLPLHLVGFIYHTLARDSSGKSMDLTYGVSNLLRVLPI